MNCEEKDISKAGWMGFYHFIKVLIKWSRPLWLLMKGHCKYTAMHKSNNIRHKLVVTYHLNSYIVKSDRAHCIILSVNYTIQ